MSALFRVSILQTAWSRASKGLHDLGNCGSARDPSRNFITLLIRGCRQYV